MICLLQSTDAVRFCQQRNEALVLTAARTTMRWDLACLCVIGRADTRAPLMLVACISGSLGSQAHSADLLRHCMRMKGGLDALCIFAYKAYRTKRGRDQDKEGMLYLRSEGHRIRRPVDGRASQGLHS